MKKMTLYLCLAGCLCFSLAGAQDENLSVLTGWDQHDIRWIQHTDAPFTALHAAVFEPDIRWLVLVETPLSYASMVLNRRYTFRSDCMVAGALTAYDLADLLACAAPRKVVLVRPVDQEKRQLEQQALQPILQYPGSAYESLDASNHLRVSDGNDAALAELIEWCAEP